MLEVPASNQWCAITEHTGPQTASGGHVVAACRPKFGGGVLPILGSDISLGECIRRCCEEPTCRKASFAQRLYGSSYESLGYCTQCSSGFAVEGDAHVNVCPNCGGGGWWGTYTTKRHIAWSVDTPAPTAVTPAPTAVPTHDAASGNTCQVQPWDDHVCPKSNLQMLHVSDELDEWSCREKLCHTQNWSQQPLVMSWISYDGKDPNTGLPKRINACFWCKPVKVLQNTGLQRKRRVAQHIA